MCAMQSNIEMGIEETQIKQLHPPVPQENENK